MNFASALGLARSVIVYRLDPLHQWRLRRFYRQILRPGDLAFDIGAHVGDRIAVWRGLGARVVGVEPQPLPFCFLRLLYGRSPDVALESFAVGAAPGKAELIISRRNPTVSSLSKNWVAATGGLAAFRNVTWDRQQSVEVTTLDALIARHGLADFCKIDVEGFEVEVLRGLTRPIPLLSFEFLASQRDLSNAALAEVKRIGDYRFNIVYAEKLRFVLPAWVRAEDLSRCLEEVPAHIHSGDIYARLQV